jgi:5,10-methylenetetrahydromethanopterin reductase
MISVAFQTDKLLSTYGSLAAAVEAYGFDGVSVYNDMLYQPAWLPLLEIARHTQRVRIGPAAANPFTCHPINIAANIALIDEVSQGRAYLGLARGAWLDFVGIEPAQPITAMREALACIRHLLSRSSAPLSGAIFSLSGGDAFRWNILRSDIPFMLGSWGAHTMRACAKYVQEIKLGGTTNPDAVRGVLNTLGESSIGIVAGAVTVVDQDGAAARALARRAAALYLPVVAQFDRSISIEPERLRGMREAAAHYDYDRAASFISDELLRRFAFAGAPDDVVAQAAALFEAGASRIEFGAPHGLTAEEGLRLLGARVLPALRRVYQ